MVLVVAASIAMKGGVHHYELASNGSYIYFVITGDCH